MRRGVTLLEVLVAAVLLAVGLLGALEVIARCAATARGVRDRSRGLIFARSKMEEILKEPVLQVGTDRGQGVDESTEFDWEAVIEPSRHEWLLTVTVAARHRISGVEVAISALRREDLRPPSEASGTGATAAGGTL